MLCVLLGLICFASLIGVIAGFSYSGSATYHSPGVKKLTMDAVFNGTFHPMSRDLRWVPEGKYMPFLLVSVIDGDFPSR